MDTQVVTQTNRKLIDIFYDYFEVIPANTPELLEAAYHLRYQVFCVETGFEDINQFPAKVEMDEFDKYSIHSLLKHQSTGHFAGTVRLILPQPDTEKCFPVHRITHHPLFFDKKEFPPDKVAEVSRFAISKEFRKRRGELDSPSAASEYDETSPDERRVISHITSGLEERRVIPHITLGLIAGLVRMSAENGIQHWFCVVERPLLRLLSRYGLYLVPCGSIVEYHGKRQPCYAHLDQFLETARKERPDVWELLTLEGKICP